MTDDLVPIDPEARTHAPTPVLTVLNDAEVMAQLWPFAQALAGSDLVPKDYRNKPANIVLVALYGRAVGMNLAESLQRIHVISGRPTMSAELIIDRVRRAGHSLVTGWDGERQAAWATLTRGDDGTTSTQWRTMAWAQRMGYTKRDQYQSQPEVMLQYRAATLVARLMAPDALYGIVYSTDELRDATTDEPATRQLTPTQPAQAMPTLGARQDDDPATGDPE